VDEYKALSDTQIASVRGDTLEWSRAGTAASPIIHLV